MQPRFEKVAVGHRESLRCVDSSVVRRFTAPWHFHAELELTLIVESQGLRFTGDRVERYAEGDLVLLGPNLPHCWVSDDAPGRARAIVVQFRESFMGDALEKVPELRRIARLLGAASRGLVFQGSLAQRAAPLVHDLPGLKGGERLFALLQLLSMLAQGRGDVSALASEGYAPRIDASDMTRMERIHRYVLSRIDDSIKLEDVARIAHLTPAAFCRYFRQVSGKTLTQLVNEIRIGNACRELTETERSVADICYGCGFNNLTHFNRQFRRQTGMTPRLYRRALAAASRT